MAQARKCDVCGILYELYDFPRKQEYYNQNSRQTVSCFLEILIYKDLCKDCLKAELTDIKTVLIDYILKKCKKGDVENE